MEDRKWKIDVNYARKEKRPVEAYKPRYFLKPLGSDIDLKTKKFRRPVSYTFLIVGAIVAVAMPTYAFYWKNKTMKDMEEGVHEDYRRIRSKGKTLSEIPRKIDQ